MKFLALTIAVSALCFCTSVCRATLISFDSAAAGSADATIINGAYANTAFGTSYTALEVTGRSPGANPYTVARSLLKFNVSSLSGQYSAINSITLRLTTSYNTTGSGTVNLHQVLSNWVESQVTFNSRQAGTPWSTAGGDFSGSVLGSVNFGPLTHSALFNGVQQQITISILPGAGNAAARQALIDSWTTGNNFGLLMKSITEPFTNGVFVGLRDRSRALASDRPLLTIEFTPVPEPASGVILVLGVLLGAALWGRKALSW